MRVPTVNALDIVDEVVLKLLAVQPNVDDQHLLLVRILEVPHVLICDWNRIRIFLWQFVADDQHWQIQVLLVLVQPLLDLLQVLLVRVVVHEDQAVEILVHFLAMNGRQWARDFLDAEFQFLHLATHVVVRDFFALHVRVLDLLGLVLADLVQDGRLAAFFGAEQKKSGVNVGLQLS